MQNLNPARALSRTDLSAGALTIATAAHGLAAGTDVVWSVRAEHIDIAPSGRYPGEVLDIAYLGAVTAITVRLDGGTELRVRAVRPGDLAIGANCRLDIDPAAIVVWPANGVADPALVSTL